MQRANLFNAEFKYDERDPAGYRAGVAPVGKLAGGEALAVKLFEIPAGQSICHYEYEEEWLIVLEGAVAVPQPVGER